jgi:hypothetical protein
MKHSYINAAGQTSKPINRFTRIEDRDIEPTIEVVDSIVAAIEKNIF